MNLLSVYQDVEKNLQKLDFSLLHPGFHKYRFALYTQEQVCLDGELLPYDERFLANTAICLDGEYIAIWDMGCGEESALDTELLTYQIVHEMFHCFQFENGETRFPNDLKLLNAPADFGYYTGKYLENQYLAEAFSQETGNGESMKKGAEALQQFSALRNSRFSRYGEYMLEELKAETAEGAAEFVGLKALKFITPAKYHAIIKNYLGKLRNDLPLLFDTRRLSYYTGALFCLAIERFQPPLKNAFGGLPIFLQNPLQTALSETMPWQPVQNCEALSREFHKLREKQERMISDHRKNNHYTACPAVICGYDPMNMFRTGNLLYCSHFLFLQSDTETIRLDGPILAVLKDGTANEVLGYY